MLLNLIVHQVPHTDRWRWQLLDRGRVLWAESPRGSTFESHDAALLSAAEFARAASEATRSGAP